MTTPPQSGQPEFPPPPPAALPEFPPAPPLPPQPAKPKRGLKVLLRFAVPIVIGLIVLAVRVFNGGSFSSASHNVGDCLKGNTDNVDSISSVDCGPDANYKVSGVVKDQNEFAVKFSSSACEPFPNTDAMYWYGKSGGTGTVFCLEDLKNPGQRMPAVGDCLKGSTAEDVKKIECGPEADYKVAAIEDAPSIMGADSSTCASVPTSSTVLSWKKSGGVLPTTKALCLEDLKNPGKRRPVVGDCVNKSEGGSVVAACDSGAKYKVAGKIDGTSQFSTDSVKKICKDFPGSTEVIWMGIQSALTGTTYCLAPNK
ncbi:hypothetical protein [Amycolatopsis sp. NPDC059657]|uniref:LppU/SCO3897 family protein n=1 Tax=Amycolatopsis sp. NPDC059657 TaxID=3346899 RepID=UPI00366C70C3